MKIEFGGVKRPVYENGVSIDRSPVLDGKGEPYAYMTRLSVAVRLVKTVDNDLDTLIADLESLYGQSADSFRLLYDDDSPTVHVFPSADRPLIGGVRCTKPLSYLKYQNGEHVSYRTGTVEFECMEMLTLAADQVIEFSETLDYEGGGQVFGHLQPNEGLATKQRLRTNELWRGTQSGRIVHLGRHGFIPPPLFPGAVVGNPQRRKETPRRIGNNFYAFPTSYTYRFESATPLNGSPSLWID